ncbi:histone [Yinghuangia sp. ASG 101]|uniref:histone n=1 Tax=Yinghuangia sp. ASG 101 TaxID=2896848 RepID=UPI001E54700B|nr:histone [Yinghuangia sp. ASG 101]UGQ10244.1 histone [Yinghuangia sp. ASG 101]
MRDALRSYLQIATGLTEMTVHRVTETARHLVEKSGVDIDQVLPPQVAQQAQAVPQYVQQVADELFATGKANRDLLVGVVRSEVDKAMGRLRPWLDDVKAVRDDVERLERRVTDLEHRLALASAAPRVRRTPPAPVEDEEPVPVRGAGTSPAAGSVKKEADEDAPVARRAVTPARAAKKAAAKKAPARKAAAKKAAASKTSSAKRGSSGGAGAKKTASGGAASKTARKAPGGKAAGGPATPDTDAPAASEPWE